MKMTIAAATARRLGRNNSDRRGAGPDQAGLPPERASLLQRLAILLIALCATGCAHMPPPAPARCDLVGYPIVVGAGENNLVARTGGAPNLSDVLPGLIRSGVAPLVAGEHDKVLVISGGSLHGAFGAGFFRGLPSVPQYKVVTAVSTGAMQSTFVFLANRKPEKTKVYPAYMHADPYLGKAGDGYLSDLALAYAINREGDLLKVNRLGYLGAALDGSIATFQPLRTSMKSLITEETIRQVASESNDRHRSLLVGVTDLDNGVGYALDLTKLAVAAGTSIDFKSARDCFVEAVLASSSVPPGVPPVTLTVNGKPQLFMDGGAKFGVFYQQVRDAVDATPSVDMDLVVNGKLFEGDWLEKGKPVKKWSLINFGLRAVDAMETEVYRFSVNDVARWGAKNGTFRVALISNAGLNELRDEPDQYPSRLDGKSCQLHHDEDAKAKPQEFYPSYMRCLIDYGQRRGETDPWNPPSALIHQ